MKVLILAGGLGLRLRPVVSDIPKVMAPIRGKPFLEYLIGMLKCYHLDSLILSVGYLKEAIIDCFGDGSAYNINIEYARESNPLGTAGAIRNAKPHLNSTFIVTNGDTYLELDYNAFVRFHKEKKALVTIALAETKNTSCYGSVEMDTTCRVTSFAEKQAGGRGKNFVNAGAYVMEPAVFRHIPSNKRISLETEILPDLIASKLPVFGFRASGHFIDIGIPSDYIAAQKFLKGKEENVNSK